MSEDLKFLEAQLNGSTQSLSRFFANEQRRVSNAHRLKNDLITLSKRGITAIQCWNRAEVLEIKAELERQWHYFLALIATVSEPNRAFFAAEAGKEMMEFYLADTLYSLLLDENAKSVDIHIFPEGVTEQIWLEGLIDAVSELGILLDNCLAADSISLARRKSLRQRFISIAKLIYEVTLSKFSQISPQVMSVSRFQSPESMYKARVRKVAGIIQRQREALVGLLDRVAV